MNLFMVGMRGDRVVVLRTAPLIHGITKEEALMLAAWLVALADPDARAHSPEGEHTSVACPALNKALQEVLATS